MADIQLQPATADIQLQAAAFGWVERRQPTTILSSFHENQQEMRSDVQGFIDLTLKEIRYRCLRRGIATRRPFVCAHRGEKKTEDLRCVFGKTFFDCFGMFLFFDGNGR